MQPQPQAQQPGMQPSQPSTQPSQAQPGQDQNAQPGQQQPQSGQMAAHPSIDDQVQSLAQQLNLSADQQAKVKTALEDQHTQAMNVVQDSSMSRDDKIQKIHTIREGTITKVRSTLNDDQKKKFDVMVQQQEQQHPQAAQPK
jgi:Mg2+ and Co2+ transporter CorA